MVNERYPHIMKVNNMIPTVVPTFVYLEESNVKTHG